MLATVLSAALKGIDAFTVRLEADLARQGMPAFTMVIRSTKQGMWTINYNYFNFLLPCG